MSVFKTFTKNFKKIGSFFHRNSPGSATFFTHRGGKHLQPEGWFGFYRYKNCLNLEG